MFAANTIHVKIEVNVKLREIVPSADVRSASWEQTVRVVSFHIPGLYTDI